MSNDAIMPPIHPGEVLMLEQLGHELGNETQAIDAVDRLVGARLVHRLAEFAFPTRAGRRAAEIEAGTS